MNILNTSINYLRESYKEWYFPYFVEGEKGKEYEYFKE